MRQAAPGLLFCSPRHHTTRPDAPQPPVVLAPGDLPKIFTILLFTEKVCQVLNSYMLTFTRNYQKVFLDIIVSFYSPTRNEWQFLTNT